MSVHAPPLPHAASTGLDLALPSLLFLHTRRLFCDDTVHKVGFAVSEDIRLLQQIAGGGDCMSNMVGIVDLSQERNTLFPEHGASATLPFGLVLHTA